MAKQPSSVGSSPDRSAPLVSDRSAQASQPADAGARAQGTVAARRVPASQQDKRYIEGLEQRGELVDVDETTDLSTLSSRSSRVTWVRFPNGDVERIQFD
jgi:hypothetical protein